MLQKKCDYFKNGGFCQSNYDSMYLEGRDITTTNTLLSAVPALRNPPITRPADVGRGYIARNGARACAGGCKRREKSNTEGREGTPTCVPDWNALPPMPGRPARIQPGVCRAKTAHTSKEVYRPKPARGRRAKEPGHIDRARNHSLVFVLRQSTYLPDLIRRSIQGSSLSMTQLRPIF